MNTNLLKTILFALACALLVSGCPGGGGGTPPYTQPPGGPTNTEPTSVTPNDGNWSISDLRVNQAEPTITIVKTEDFPLPNCGGTGPLKMSLATQKSVEKGITIGDKATIGGSIEVDIPPAVKLKLQAEVEHAYQQTLKDVETRLDTITMEADAGTNVVYVISWELQTYQSNIDFAKETEVLQTPYTFTLRVPKVTDSHHVNCPSTPPAEVSPTDTSTPTPTPTPTPKPSCRVSDTFLRTSDAMVMMCVPAGTFQMGSETGESRERPVHEVTLDSFWIDRTEVTNSQYAQCVEAKQCHEPLDKTSASRAFYYGNPDFAHYPVSNARWIDAQSYCAWAGGQLPTEAQWEYAARGPKGNIYPWGNDPPNNELLNYNKAVGNTTEVGSYPRGASWVGALDMAGNDWEWVNDWQGAYPDSPQTNPTGPASGQFKLLRGGSWFFPGDVARTTFRAPGNSPDNYGQDYGFRCAAAGPGG